MTRVLILEPDPWRYRGLCSVLKETGEFDILEEHDYGRILSLSSAPEGMELDVVGLAHRLVLEYGVAIIALLRDIFDPCSVIVHGEVEAVEVAAQVYAAGARGYFVLSHPPGLYPKAVTVVARGKYWGPREAVALMAEKAVEGQPVVNRVERVDQDERHLLSLLNEGLSNKEIGQRLGLAEATIKARFNRLYKKFGVASRLQLLRDPRRSDPSAPINQRRSHRLTTGNPATNMLSPTLMTAAVEQVLRRFEEMITAADGEKYTVYLHGRRRPGDTWQGWLEFERASDGKRFPTPIETTQPEEKDVVYWASGLSQAYFEGALHRALRGSLPQQNASPSAKPLITRGVDHQTLESRRAMIQKEILSLFRRAGERRLLTRDVFSALPYGHADVVRAIDDLEKTQRTLIRRTEEGNDWLFLMRS